MDFPYLLFSGVTGVTGVTSLLGRTFSRNTGKNQSVTVLHHSPTRNTEKTGWCYRGAMAQIPYTQRFQELRNTVTLVTRQNMM
jgi:hypothetical protein